MYLALLSNGELHQQSTLHVLLVWIAYTSYMYMYGHALQSDSSVFSSEATG